MGMNYQQQTHDTKSIVYEKVVVEKSDKYANVWNVKDDDFKLDKLAGEKIEKNYETYEDIKDTVYYYMVNEDLAVEYIIRNRGDEKVAIVTEVDYALATVVNKVAKHVDNNKKRIARCSKYCGCGSTPCGSPDCNKIDAEDVLEGRDFRRPQHQVVKFDPDNPSEWEKTR